MPRPWNGWEKPRKGWTPWPGILQRQPEDRSILACGADIAARHEPYFPLAAAYCRRLYALDRGPAGAPPAGEAAGIPEQLQGGHSPPGRGGGRVSRGPGGPAPAGPAVLLAAGLPGRQRDLSTPAGEERREFRPAPGGGQGRGCGPGLRRGFESVPLALRPPPGPEGIRPAPGPALGPKGQPCRGRGVLGP